jgi:hypothetical protein
VARVHGGYNRYIDTSTLTNPKVPASSADVPAGAAIVLCILNRTAGGATVTGISDPVNGAWDLSQWSLGNPSGTLIASVASPDNSSVYCRANSGAQTGGANRIVSVTFSSGISAVIAIGWTRDDAATLVVGSVGTTLTQTAQTNWDTAAFAVPDAGCIVGGLVLATSQGGTAPTMDGAGETLRTTVADAGVFRSNIITQDVAAAGNEGFESTIAAASNGNYFQFSLALSTGVDPPPTITSIDADDVVAYDDVAVPIVLTDGDGSATVTFEQTGGVSVSQTIGSQSATLITLSSVTGFAQGGALKNGAATARVTNADLQDDTHAFTITPPPIGDIDYEDLSTAAVSGQKLTALPALASGDQVEWTNVTGIGGYTVADVTIYTDHTVSWTSGVAAFDVRYYDNTAKEWSAWVTQTIDAIVAASTGAGRSTRRKQRYYVEVDGQNFPVDSRAEAEAILRRARDLARKDADAQGDATVKKLARKPVVPVVDIPPPVVTASPELELGAQIAEIEALYRQAAENAELRLRMALAIAEQEREDEDELLLLL